MTVGPCISTSSAFRSAIVVLVCALCLLSQKHVAAAGSSASPGPTQGRSGGGEQTARSPYEQWLAVHETAIKSADRAVDDFHRTVDNQLDLVSIVFIAMTIIGIGGLWFCGLAHRRARDALRQASDCVAVVTDVQSKSRAVERTHRRLVQAQGKLEQAIQEMRRDAQGLGDEIRRYQRLARKDVGTIKGMLELAQVDQYALLVTNDAERHIAILALLEMSRRSDPAVRKRCIDAFSELDKYDETVAGRLAEMAQDDVQPGIKRAAAQAANKLHQLPADDGD